MPSLCTEHFHPGLVSVTFRKLSPRQIVELVCQARLTCIEWGGDVHVPHGDLARAREVCQMTQDAGLKTCAYGSYYRVGLSETNGLPFRSVLDTALELRTDVIRVWAGKGGSAQTDADGREKIIADTRRIADLAVGSGVCIAFEYHGNTLTDTPESALSLLQMVNHSAVQTYWQPSGEPSTRRTGLRQILPWLRHLHVYQWQLVDGKNERRSLSEGKTVWLDYLAGAAESGRDHAVLLEFVRNDSPEQFLADAATLRSWIV